MGFQKPIGRHKTHYEAFDYAVCHKKSREISLPKIHPVSILFLELLIGNGYVFSSSGRRRSVFVELNYFGCDVVIACR